MVESHLKWFRHGWRRILETTVRREVQMEGSPKVRGRRRTRKNIGQTFKKDLDLNDLFLDMIYNYGVI